MLGIQMRDDPAHWRQRAQESRAEADKLNDPYAKRTMLEIAEAFARLAVLAEERNKTKVVDPS
jgi:hypothetical protein